MQVPLDFPLSLPKELTWQPMAEAVAADVLDYFEAGEPEETSDNRRLAEWVRAQVWDRVAKLSGLGAKGFDHVFCGALDEIRAEAPEPLGCAAEAAILKIVAREP